MVSSNPAVAPYAGCAAILLISLAALASDIGPAHQKPDPSVDKFVAQKLQIWQERLNLKDWDIRYQFLRRDQLEPKTLGNIHWDSDIKGARISVLDPRDYQLSKKDMLDDMEFTVVHELVHLKLSSLPRSEASRRVEEYAVNEIAKALLNLAKR